MIPNDLSISKKKTAPKIIIKISKATKNPFVKETRADKGRIRQKTIANPATKTKVINEVQRSDILLTKRRNKNKIKGIIDKKSGKEDITYYKTKRAPQANRRFASCNFRPKVIH